MLVNFPDARCGHFGEGQTLLTLEIPTDSAQIRGDALFRVTTIQGFRCSWRCVALTRNIVTVSPERFRWRGSAVPVKVHWQRRQSILGVCSSRVTNADCSAMRRHTIAHDADRVCDVHRARHVRGVPACLVPVFFDHVSVTNEKYASFYNS